MDSMFGVPMQTIMGVLLGILGLFVLSIVYIALRHRVPFKLGLRNVPRRRAQTAIVTLGLMLGTLIISAALTTGDSVDRSITAIIYDQLGAIDEVVAFQAEDATANSRDTFLPQDFVDEFIATFEHDPDIDGVMPMFHRFVPVVNFAAGQSEPNVAVVGLDPARLDDFGGLALAGGGRADLAALGPDEVYVAEGLAETLDLHEGETLALFYQGRQHDFRIAGLVEVNALSGANGENGNFDGGLVLPLDRAQALFEAEGTLEAILISNRGDDRAGLTLTDTVIAKVEEFLGDRPYEVEASKRDALKEAELAGNAFSTLFLAMGLFSIGAGVLLIFLIFTMLAAERKPEMGMARAVGMQRRHLMYAFMSEGMIYSVLSSAVGVVLGVVVAFGMVRILKMLFADLDLPIEAYVHPRSLVVAYSLGMSVTFITVVISSWRVSRLNIVRAIRDLPEPQMARAGKRSLAFGIVLILLGVLMVPVGISTKSQFPFYFGLSAVPLGLGLVLRFFGVAPRVTFTGVGVILLALWLAPEEFHVAIAGELSGSIEMFFLSGAMLVTAATLVIVFNAGVFSGVLGLLGRGATRLLPAVRTAVAYPIANRFRTGLTIAMFSFVTFAVVTMTAVNTNFAALFTSEEATAGWDVLVQTNVNNPVDDLRAALAEEDSKVAGEVDAVGRVDSVGLSASSIRRAGASDWETYVLHGVDDEFARETEMPLQTRARGYESDEAVWEALRTEPGTAVIDGFAVPGNGTLGFGGPTFRLEGVKTGDATMEPFEVEVRNAVTDKVERVRIIGVIQTKISTAFGLYLHRDTFGALFPDPHATEYVVRFTEGTDDVEAAREIEADLMTRGVQAKSVREILKDQQAQSRGFLYLMQGFMALGLLVGIAALGVVTLRAIAERRQQIGVLRAIGFQRGTVALSFLLEAMITAVMGIGSGAILALITSYQLFKSDYFANTAGASFIIPWPDLTVFLGIALAASLLMAYFPARAAASVNITSALRYE